MVRSSTVREECCSAGTATAEGARLDEWLRLVLACVPALLWATGRDLRITAAAGAGAALAGGGRRPGELVGMHLAEVLGADEQGAVQLAMHGRALAGEPVAFGWRWRGRSLRCRIDAVRDDLGSIIGVVGVAIDETEHEAERTRILDTERRLRAAQALARVWSWERDLDADRAVWSDEIYPIFGVHPERFDGTMAAHLARCHPDDVERVARAYSLVVSRPGPLEIDFRILRPDGAVRVVHQNMERFGPGRRIIGAAQDVTEERAAAQRLKDALSLLEATLESTADGLLVVDLAGTIVRFNAKFATIWRIPDDILASRDDRRARDFVLDQTADPAAFAAGVQAIYADPERECRDDIALKDGRTLERYSQPQRIEGRPVGRVWSFRDVTCSRRAQAAREQLLAAERLARESAQASEERARLLAEASRLLTSLDHESALSSLAHLLAGPFADCCAIDMLEPTGLVRRVALAPDGARAGALPCRPPEGATCLAEEAGVALLGVPLAIAGRILGALRLSRARPRTFAAADLALAEDVAGRASMAIEIARLYRRTEEALQARDEFLSVASHELRTPVATLQATTDALLAGAHGGVPPESALGRPLRSIGRQVRRLSRLSDQILDAIAISTTGIDLHLAEGDLSAVAADVVRRIEADGARPPGAITVSTPGPVRGRWDLARIEQLVGSLVSNALRYGAGKPVAVEVERRGEVAVLTVRDQGVGIAPERIPAVFDRFERAGVSRSWGGLGLGLYIDQAIVRLHGGEIRVESRPGEGATFFVELPLTGPRGPA